MCSKLYLLVLLLLIRLDVLAQVQNDSCHQAVEVFCGQTYDVVFGSQRDESSAPLGDCDQYDRDESVWFKIVGNGDIIQLSICDNSSSPTLVVFDGACDELVCTENVARLGRINCGSFSEELRFPSIVGQTYLVYCSSLHPDRLSQLQVQCLESTANDSCQNAILIELDSSYLLEFTNAASEIESPCGGYAAPDIWFEVIGDGNVIVFEEDCRHCSFPIEFYSGTCGELICEPRFFVADFESAWMTEAGQKYLFKISNSSNRSHNFKFRRFEIAANALCEDAVPISLQNPIEVTFQNALIEDLKCGFSSNQGKVLWYEIQGCDSVLNISASQHGIEMFMFSGPCGDLKCQSITRTDSIFSYFLDGDSIYYLALLERSYAIEDTTIIEFSKWPRASNNNAYDAITIECGEMIDGFFAGALSSHVNYAFEHPTLWYRFIGNDEYVSLQVEGPHHYGALVSIFRESPQMEQLYFRDFNFFEKDSAYLIAFSAHSIDSFSFMVDCEPIVINDVCHQAISASIGDTLFGDNLFSNVDEMEVCNGYVSEASGDVWYSFVGNGTLQDIMIEAELERHLQIYEGDCSDLQCPTIYYDTFGMRLFLKPGQVYYLRVHYPRYRKDERSPFKIYFTEQLLARNDSCEGALDLTGASSVKDSTDYSKITLPDCQEDDPIRDVWFKLNGTGKIVELVRKIDNQYGFTDGVVISLFKGNCGNLICVQDKLIKYRGRVVFMADEGQEYFIKMASHGQFEYEINCHEPLPNDEVEDAVVINCGDQFSGFSFQATYNPIPDCSYTFTEPDFWFRIQGADEYLYVNHEGIFSDRDNVSPTSVFTMGANGNLICEGRFIDDRFFLDEGITYFIRYENHRQGRKFHERDYSISFSCFPRPTNDFCEDAELISCGVTRRIDNTHASDDTYDTDCRETRLAKSTWYKLPGDGGFKEIKLTDEGGQPVSSLVKIYLGTCGNFTCINDYVGRFGGNGPTVFYAEKEQEYFIGISGTFGVANLNVDCPPQITNENCHEAAVISCGQTVSSSLNYSLPCDYADQCPENREVKRAWYKFTGTGQLVEFILEMNSHNSHYQVEIYGGSCCQPVPINSLYGNSKSKIFQSETGREYLIAVSQRTIWDGGDYSLQVVCKETSEASICETAIDLMQDSIYTRSFVGAINSFVVDDSQFDDRVLWFQFEGSGGVDTIVSTSNENVGWLVQPFLKDENNCDLIQPYELTMHASNDAEGVHTMIIGTRPQQFYVLAVLPTYYKVNQVSIGLKKGQHPSICQGSIGRQSSVSESGHRLITPIITGSSKPFVISVGNHRGRDYIRDWEGETISISSSIGRGTIEYSNQDCQGHIPFEFISNNPQPLICPDSILPCQRRILHRGLILPSYHHKAIRVIRSNSDVEKGASLIYSAGHAVHLNRSFSVPEGTFFEINMENCSDTLGNNDDDDDDESGN